MTADTLYIIGVGMLGGAMAVAGMWGRTCPGCKGRRIKYQTDGTPVECSECGGTGEVE